MIASATIDPAPRDGWVAALRASLFAFLISRLIVVLAAAIGVAQLQQWPVPAPDGASPTLRPADSAVVDTLARRALENDAGWYLSISQQGYTRRDFTAERQENWAFFPLHPWLWKAAMATGLAPLPAGLLLANLLFLAGLFQAHRWLQVVAQPGAADRAVLCVALFPTAYFFSLPWTESLFLFLLASSLLAIETRRWGAASAFAALASGTRLVGILLMPLLWCATRGDDGLRPSLRWIYAAIATLGLLVFMTVLWHATGNPIAFADIQAAWGRDGGSLIKPFRRWLQDPGLLAQDWNVIWLNNAAILLGLAACIALWRQGRRALSGFVLVSVLLPWSSGTVLSSARYLSTCLPVFLVLAGWLHRPAAFLAWLLFSTLALAWLSAAFFASLSFAGA